VSRRERRGRVQAGLGNVEKRENVESGGWIEKERKGKSEI